MNGIMIYEAYKGPQYKEANYRNLDINGNVKIHVATLFNKESVSSSSNQTLAEKRYPNRYQCKNALDFRHLFNRA